AEHGAVVDLLKGFAIALVPGNLADEQDHRRRILEGDMNAGGGIGGAGAARDEGHSRAAGKLDRCFGHHGGAALLAADDGLDAAAVEPVESGKKALARDAEHPFHALDLQLIDQDLPAMARAGAAVGREFGHVDDSSLSSLVS